MSVLLAVTVVLGLAGLSTATVDAIGWRAYQPLASSTFPPGAAALPAAHLAARIADPGFLVLLAVALLFLWGVAWPMSAPWGLVYRRLVQPRLRPAADLEDPRPPRFAQGVGLAVSTLGLVLHAAGVPWALPIAAAAAFVAAFLNAVFGFCLGCRIYLLLQRAGLAGRARRA